MIVLNVEVLFADSCMAKWSTVEDAGAFRRIAYKLHKFEEYGAVIEEVRINKVMKEDVEA